MIPVMLLPISWRLASRRKKGHSWRGKISFYCPTWSTGPRPSWIVDATRHYLRRARLARVLYPWDWSLSQRFVWNQGMTAQLTTKFVVTNVLVQLRCCQQQISRLVDANRSWYLLLLRVRSLLALHGFFLHDHLGFQEHRLFRTPGGGAFSICWGFWCAQEDWLLWICCPWFCAWWRAMLSFCGVCLWTLRLASCCPSPLVFGLARSPWLSEASPSGVIHQWAWFYEALVWIQMVLLDELPIFFFSLVPVGLVWWWRSVFWLI